MAGRRARRRDPGTAAMTVVPGTGKDMADVDALYESVGWSAPGSIRSRDRFLLARAGRSLVGALMYWVDDEPDLLPQTWTAAFGAAPRLLVQEIAVAPAHRRTGVGRALMAAVAREAIGHAIGYLWTWPSPRGTDAARAARVAFFAACGMTEFRSPTGELELVAPAAEVLAASLAPAR